MKNLVDSLDNETARILLGSILAILGGAVRVCGNEKYKAPRKIISSLMASLLAGYITAVVFNNRILDRDYFGVVCALGGYSGQLVLVMASKKFEKIFIGRSISDD